MNKIIKIPVPINFYALIDFFLKFVLLVIVLSVFVPFSPKMPAPGLDPSWALGLNQAVAQGLSFGKDIIFTLGPYAAIYTKSYHPATDFMMMSGSLYLALSYWICLSFLMKGIKWHWTLLFCVLLFAMIYVRDSLFFSYPLVVGLACFKMISHNDQKITQYSLVYLALIFAPFGLFTLIKGSLFILCAFMAIFCSIFFIINNRKNFAFVCLTSPIASLLLFWLAAGQSVSNLHNYVASTLYLASGFTEAMSTEGSNQEIILYLLNSAVILLFIAWRKHIPSTSRLFVVCIFFVFLFLSFKTGFTRHYGHAFIASSSILTAALLLPFIANSKVMLLIIVASVNTWSTINNHYTHISIRNNCKSTYMAAWFGLKNRIQDPNGLKQDFDLTMNFLRERSSFPALPGSTDIYSASQAYLIASQNTWSPRPVFQSYSVFTANLAEKNKNHLLGNRRPDNIMFKIEPIDERIPALEDGLSWPLLLANYQPIRMINDFLLLQKKFPLPAKSMELLTNETHFLGEIVKLPEVEKPLFAEIEITPTIGGRLAIFFFKPTQLTISFQLKNGLKKQYRIIANMAKSGFLISPLIENTTEFAMLFNNPNDLSTKMVKSFQISSNQGKFWQWNNEYVIHYKQITRA